MPLTEGSSPSQPFQGPLAAACSCREGLSNSRVQEPQLPLHDSSHLWGQAKPQSHQGMEQACPNKDCVIRGKGQTMLTEVKAVTSRMEVGCESRPTWFKVCDWPGHRRRPESLSELPRGSGVRDKIQKLASLPRVKSEASPTCLTQGPRLSSTGAPAALAVVCPFQLHTAIWQARLQAGHLAEWSVDRKPGHCLFPFPSVYPHAQQLRELGSAGSCSQHPMT